jgi:hypothetical protein
MLLISFMIPSAAAVKPNGQHVSGEAIAGAVVLGTIGVILFLLLQLA